MTRKMKWLGALALLVGAGYFGFQKYGIAIPGMIAQLREPIADNHPVSWSQGPATPPASSTRATDATTTRRASPCGWPAAE